MRDDNEGTGTVKLAVQSESQRVALRGACGQILNHEEHDRADSEDGRNGFSLLTCEAHVAEATALEAELEDGCSTVHVGLGIAGQLTQAIAEQIEGEMLLLVEGTNATPIGVHVRRGAELMRILAALDAAVARALMPVS